VGAGRVGVSRPPKPELGCWGLVLEKNPRPPTPVLLELGYSETPEVRDTP
jgi:hypothetical protein